MDKEKLKKELIIEEPYKSELASGIITLGPLLLNSKRKSLIRILNYSKCVKVIKKCKVGDTKYFPTYVFMYAEDCRGNMDNSMKGFMEYREKF